MPKKSNWSITRITFLVMLVVAGIGWLVCCAEYAKDAEDWEPTTVQSDGEEMPRLPTGRRGQSRALQQALLDAVVGTVSITANAFQQIPNAPAVLSFGVTQRTWWFVGFAIVECLVLAFGAGLYRLERQLEGPTKRRRKKAKSPVA